MYFYEKIQNSKNLDDFVKYFDENYEKDKTEALKEGPVQLWATLDMIVLLMRTHRELYIKKYSAQDYEKLRIKNTGKTPIQLVEADLEAVVAKYKGVGSAQGQESQVSRYNLFSDSNSLLQELPELREEDLSDLENQSSWRRYGSLGDQYSDSDEEADNDNWCKRFWRKIC